MRLKTEGPNKNGETSLLEKVIVTQRDEKIATIMALDLILVGIDTVRENLNKIEIKILNKWSLF